MTRQHMMTGAAICLIFTLVGCASILRHENSDKMLQNQEFDSAVHIKEIVTPTPVPGATPAPTPAAIGDAHAGAASVAPSTGSSSGGVKASLAPSLEKKAKKKKKGASESPSAAPASTKHEPEIENGEGFIARRPVADPFHVGENTVLELSYMGVAAGDLQMKVLPFVEVNDRKSYHFQAQASSTSVFAMFYAVDDAADTFVDFETLTPSSYKLAVKESKQLRDTREYFDWQKLKGFYWDKKITKDHGLQEKKLDWVIEPYAQNLISAVFYLRAFKLETGKSYKYRVATEGKNMVVTAEVVRREAIETQLGTVKAIVVRPTFQVDGVFKPTGEILFWLSDDDRRFFLRIESKIKIGKIIGQVKKIEKGAE